MSHTTKIAIIGAGMVGSSAAYAVMIKGLASEILLIDVDEKREEGEVMDLSHALMGTATGSIRRGDFSDCSDVDIIILTAGAPQIPGQSRLELASKNIAILKTIIRSLPKLRDDSIFIVVSNPVDILAHIARKMFDMPHSQVFGSGTSLDTYRLRYNVSQELKADMRDIQGFVLGEHGDSEFTAWSTVYCGSKKVFQLLSEEKMKEIEIRTSQAAYEIIQRKRATYYGIGMVIAEIVEKILHNEKSIIPVSAIPGKFYGITDISLGIPVVLGTKGIEKVWEVDLTAQEKICLEKSAEILRGVLKIAS